MADEIRDLMTAARGLASVLRQGQTYTEAADRIMAYDSQPYPVPYVFMSPTVAVFLRALAAAEGVEMPSTTMASSLPAYGPALREPVSG